MRGFFMKNLIDFISKHALFFLIAGALLFIIAVSSISNLPNPSMLSPIHVEAEYYKPLRFYGILRFFSILLILTSAFFFVQGISKKSDVSGMREPDGFCPNCGTSIVPKDLFCSQCGAKRKI